MAGPEEPIREEAWKTRDDSHNQSYQGAELNATSGSLLSTPNCTTLGYNMTTLTDQTLEQDASTTDCHQRHENLEIDPSLQEPFFTSPSVVGRRWHSLRRCYHRERSQNFDFTVISYNVLADGLLHSHSHLYVGVEHWMKEWEYRRRNLLQEILYYNADVICLQEVESCHYEEWFEPKLAKEGYAGIYMKRTGDKADGCATFFRNSRFTLVKSQLVSFRKPGVELMDRDNVAIVVLLEPKATNRSSRHSNNLICVSNTHLLFNMKRGDIKLAQLAWLFAEINEIARISPSEDGDGHHHHPIICCGDFNSTPYSQIYNFVARGCLDYNGMFRENLSGQGHFHTYYSQPITRNIIPWELGIDSFCCKRNEDSSDFCIDSVDQHQVNLQPSASFENSAKTKDFFVQAAVSSQFQHLQSTCSKVQVDQLKDKEVESDIMSSESWELSTDSSVSIQRHAANFMSSSSKEYSITGEPSSSANSKDKFQDGEENSCELTVNSSERDLYDSCTFQRHAFHFYSVYRHTLRSGRPAVTTFHDRTCTTVDYMFVSPGIRQHCHRCRTLHGPLQLTGNLELLPEEDIWYLGGLPNKFLSSDHLSLFASFLLHL